MKSERTGLRIYALLILAAVLIASVSYAAAPDEYSESTPTLYYNEAPWSGRMQCAESDGEYYIPIDLFSCVPYISLSVMTEEDAFLIRNSRTGDELSALCTIERAWLNGTVIDFPVNKVENGGITYYYVRSDLICDAMGFGFDVFETPAGRTMARIRDGGSVMDFERFLKATVPSDFGNGAFDLPVQDDVYPQTVFLTFCGINEYTDAILDALAGKNMTACFFLSAEDIGKTETVKKIVSLGFRTGINASSYSDASAIDALNGALYDITMRKTHFVRCGEAAGNEENYPPRGYIDCTETVLRSAYIGDYHYINACIAAKNSVMALEQNEQTVSFLSQLESLGVVTAELSISR